MKNPLELKVLRSNRELSTGKLWVLRVFILVAGANALVTVGPTSTVQLVASVVGIVAVYVFLLVIVSSDPDPEELQSLAD
jgi:hypothetical protein